MRVLAKGKLDKSLIVPEKTNDTKQPLKKYI